MKLLIVDDSSMMRTVIQQYLQDFDLDIVGEANNGVVALELFKKTRPDMVTLDITMPEMDGLQCLKKMLAVLPQTTVVMITALADKATGLIAMSEGAKAFLVKPVTHE
ncbi:MAG: response regulator, partial [Calditrichaeota bacterium]|nr:response regulator [Calditrichota bacterium]